MINAKTEEICDVNIKKFDWFYDECTFVDLTNFPRNILLDFDSPEMDEYYIDTLLYDIAILDISVQVKLCDNIYDIKDNVNSIDGLIESIHGTSASMWFKEYKDKMNYAEFTKKHPEWLV